MTYLRTLAALAVGAAPRLTHRVPGRFEPLDTDGWDAGWDTGWGEELAEREATVAVEVPPPGPDPLVGSARTPAPAPVARPDRVPGPTTAAPPPAGSPATVAGAAAQPPLPPTPPPAGTAAVPGRAVPQVFVSLVSPAPPLAEPTEQSTVDGVGPVPRPAPVAPRPTGAPPGRRPARTVPPAERGAPEPRPRPLVPAGEARPVHVHIGRVEVRAVLTPPPAPAAAPPAAAPVPSAAPDLEAYLRDPGAAR